MNEKRDWTKVTANGLIWVIYILLLGVLLPHTAWAFAKFEPIDSQFVAWGGAFAFEAAIAVLTHKLAKHIEFTARHKSAWRRFSARYLNAYGGGLLIAWVVSTLANLAHSVEFGQALKIFADYGIPAPVYAVAFGAILPTTSLLFARILSNVIEQDNTETEANPELERANGTIRELRDQLRQTEQRAKATEQAAKQESDRLQRDIETLQGEFNGLRSRFAEMERLFSEDKKERILAAHTIWPKLPGSGIAVIAESSPSYVSEVLNSSNGKG